MTRQTAVVALLGIAALFLLLGSPEAALFVWAAAVLVRLVAPADPVDPSRDRAGARRRAGR